jgi:TIR domain
MDIFVSHAAIDKDSAHDLVDFLQLGMGVHPDRIFYSSMPGSIPVGVDFVDHILKELKDAKLVLCLLSQAYIESQFCIAELGAARMAAFKDPTKVFCFTCLIEPLDYKKLGGMLVGVQSGMIAERAVQADLREVTRKVFKNPTFIPEKNWIASQEKFIDKLEKNVSGRQASKKLAESIRLRKVKSELREDLVHKRKIFFIFQNLTSEEIIAGPSNWEGTVRLYEDFSPLRMKVMENQHWSGEKNSVVVPGGTEFCAWVSLDMSADDKYLFSQAALNDLGTIKVALSKGGVMAERIFKI